MPQRRRLDSDAQPTDRRFNAARLSDRAIDELVGLCRGVAVDLHVSPDEARGLLRWIECNRNHAAHWPANVIYVRLKEMLADGVLDEAEQAELLDLMRDVTGGSMPVAERVASYTTLLPLDDPAPELVFAGRVFCMTGKFVFGSRKQCHAAVESLGGIVQTAPSGATRYLVIGAVGSRDWIHSTHGRKIEAAVKLRERYRSPAIVSEEHWTRSLQSANEG